MLMAAAFLVGVSSLASEQVPASLLTLRESELQQLSVCPTLPSVGVVGDDTAALFLTRLHAAAGDALTLVERQRLEAVTAEMCLGPAFDPATTAAAGNLLFAMYLVDVRTGLGTSPMPVSVTAIRTDTGAVVLHRETSLASPGVDALGAFFDTVAADLRGAISAQASTCSPTFTATIVEDVTLACAGTIAATGGAYAVESTFTVEFSLPGFDYSTRGIAQSLTGTARLLPATARTTLDDTVRRESPRCAFTMENHRVLDIGLAHRVVPASFSLLIPHDASADWTFTPAVPTAAALFQGDATLTATMTTTAAGTCTSPGGTVTQTTPYVHRELATPVFAPQLLRPVCGTGHVIPVALTRVPNLGTPGVIDITSSCSARSARARFSFRRQ